MAAFRKQRTIGREQVFCGIGIHSGQEVEMRLVPGEEGTGVVFRRMDLSGQPVVPATIEYVSSTARGTNVGIGDVVVMTVEHVLAALRAFEIDNVCVELSNCEPPAGNGSSDIFVEMLDRAGVVEQSSEVPIAKICEPVWLEEGGVTIVGLPSDRYQVSYTLHYPKIEVLGTQHFCMDITQENFCEQVASCRTFALYDELNFLMDRGLIRGGSLENAVVIHDDAIVSKGGLYFKDEAVRHKVLDLIGDLSLVGIPFVGHIIALMSGHATNCLFAKKLYHHLSREKV